MKNKILVLLTFLACGNISFAQAPTNQFNGNSRFEQLGASLPTPNTYRTASGSPGRDYWQNRADYDIKAELNDANQSLTGSETITYKNFSPDELRFLWVQLDQNNFKENADAQVTRSTSLTEKGTSFGNLQNLTGVLKKTDFGYKITAVKDLKGANIPYTINQTMMRVDLATPLKAGGSTTFQIEWNFNIVDAITSRARSGYEYFPKDGNYIYEMSCSKIG